MKKVTELNNGMPPDVVWCCAGYSLPGFFASTSIDTLRSQMDTLYWSAAYMAHAAIQTWTGINPPWPHPTERPGSKIPGNRHIIFTNSVLGFFTVAGYSPYSPAKAAMKSLADTLRQEVEVYNGVAIKQVGSGKDRGVFTSNIKIHTVYPSGILTPGLENENLQKPKVTVKIEEGDKPQTAGEVAKVAIRELEKGRTSITTSFLGRVMKGAGLQGAPRESVVDLFYNLLGGVAVLFVTPDILRKCRNWGKKYGMEGAK